MSVAEFGTIGTGLLNCGVCRFCTETDKELANHCLYQEVHAM